MRTLLRESVIPAPAAAVWAFHARPGAFERLCPPWQGVKVERAEGAFAELRVTLSLPVGPARATWIAQHEGYVEGRSFRDRQVRGPFGSWVHTHEVAPLGPDRCVLRDRVEYEPPGGQVGAVVLGRKIARDLETVFAFRHRRTAHDVLRHAPWAGRPPLRIVVAGSGGVIGRQLVPYLLNAGHRVDRLLRPGSSAPPAHLPTGIVRWDPAPAGGAAPWVDLEALAGADVIVNLAGHPIATRWNARAMALIRGSRVGATALLARAAADLPVRPALINASGVSLYPDQRRRDLDETCPADRGYFIADVANDWEAALAPALEAGVRTVTLRIGVVLTSAGGMLARLAPAFRWMLGGRLGDGGQYISWISMDDLLAIVERAAHDSAMAGVYNAVSPRPVTSLELARTLGRVLRRPAVVPAPGWALRLAFGRMGEVALRSVRAVPGRLLEAGFEFRGAELEAVLRDELGRPSRGAYAPAERAEDGHS